MPAVTTRRDPTPVLAIALGAGVLGGIQPKINAVLGDRLNSSVIATLVNFAMALFAVCAVVAFRPETRRHLSQVHGWPVPRWTLTAGLGGTLVVLSGVVSVQTIGVAIFSVAFFAGQITSGLLVDRIGIGAGGVRLFETSRLEAAGLAIAAVVVAQIGRPIGEFAPGLVAFVVLGGAASAFQSAFNGRIANALGDPFAPTAMNVAIGTIALVIVVVVMHAGDDLQGARWPTEPWLYVGGLLGVTIVFSLAVATATLGVLRSTIAMLAAQLVTAFAVDWVIEDRVPTPAAVVGAALIVGAVALIRRG